MPVKINQLLFKVDSQERKKKILSSAMTDHKRPYKTHLCETLYIFDNLKKMGILVNNLKAHTDYKKCYDKLRYITTPLIARLFQSTQSFHFKNCDIRGSFSVTRLCCPEM